MNKPGRDDTIRTCDLFHPMEARYQTAPRPDAENRIPARSGEPRPAIPRVHFHPMSSLDLELVRHALAVARQHGYVEVELGVDGWEFKAHLEPAPKLPVPAVVAETVAGDGTKPIKATLVGYYTKSKAPMKKGQKVKAGDVIAGITALGIANDVESTISGEITEVLVKEGDPVEYGQTLAVVRVEV